MGLARSAQDVGDGLVVTRLDRLTRSLPDARDIVDELTTHKVKLNLVGSVHDPTDPVGRLPSNVLAMVTEFESDLIRMRTREGPEVARAAGKLRGRKPKLSPSQERNLVQLHHAGEKNSGDRQHGGVVQQAVEDRRRNGRVLEDLPRSERPRLVVRMIEPRAGAPQAARTVAASAAPRRRSRPASPATDA